MTELMQIFATRDQSNNLDLRYGIQSRPGEAIDRWLVMSNGRTEWLEKYADLASDLGTSPGTGYLSFDHRGQGNSGGARAWIDSYKTYAEDMAKIIESGTQGKPYNLICHSMGCLIALTALTQDLIKPRCVVLSSPLIGMPQKPMPASMAFKLSKFLTAVKLGFVHSGGGRHMRPPFEDNNLTHSIERYDMIRNTPYPVPSPTFSWVKASYEATQEILKPEKLKKLNSPILVLCGTEESVVDIHAIQPWVQLANAHASAPVEFQWIQGGRHELLVESKPLRDQTLLAIKQWFQKVGCPI